MSKKIALLEQEVATNNKIADLVLIEIKALFAKSIAKIQFSPEVTQITPQQHLVPVEQFKLREVIVPTSDHAPTGVNYAHPVKLEYNNPITAIFVDADKNRVKFETKDGVISVHPGDTNQYTRKEISPLASEIAKIQVWHDKSYLIGLKFYNKAGAVV